MSKGLSKAFSEILVLRNIDMRLRRAGKQSCFCYSLWHWVNHWMALVLSCLLWNRRGKCEVLDQVLMIVFLSSSFSSGKRSSPSGCTCGCMTQAGEKYTFWLFLGAIRKEPSFWGFLGAKKKWWKIRGTGATSFIFMEKMVAESDNKVNRGKN